MKKHKTLEKRNAVVVVVVVYHFLILLKSETLDLLQEAQFV